jgi:hypothetical protein
LLKATHAKCTCCYLVKQIDDFYKATHKKSGYRSTCKECDKAYHRKWYADNPEKAREQWVRASKKYDPRPSRRKRLYGLSVEEYEALLKAQNNICAICKAVFPDSVDHDHKTKKVRGLLCGNCNKGLGLLGDSIESLEDALNYLRGGLVPQPVS